MEMSRDEEDNPIKQDTKKGALRYLTYGDKGVPHNYGFLPQTWEDPEDVNKDTGLVGDSDPLDVVEIGSRVKAVGEVSQVKILGCLCLIDDSETDWKLFAVDCLDPLAARVSDISDLERELPGLVAGVREWYRMYKTVDGKPENEYGFNGETRDAKYSVEVIQECHDAWLKLLAQFKRKGVTREPVVYPFPKRM